MTSNDVLGQLNAIDKQLAPMLGSYAQAPTFFKQGLNKAFDYGLPLLKEGSALEAGAYQLPGTLLEQYNQDFGDVYGGPSAGARLNSILGRIGNQFALADLAGGLADRQGSRIEQMANDLTKQYGMQIQGMKDRYNMKVPIWQGLMGREDAAAARASAGRGYGGGGSNPLQFLKALMEVQNRPQPVSAGKKASVSPNYYKKYASTSSTMNSVAPRKSLFPSSGSMPINPKSSIDQLKPWYFK